MNEIRVVSGEDEHTQCTGKVFVREIGWRGTRTDKLTVDEFLDLEYNDIEEASPASKVLENTWSS